MRLGHLDLNLLIALDALLEERSVSAAAERLCLSQSATSSALGRLREYFKDDLLVMKGRDMVATARGESLVEPVRTVLSQIRSNIAVAPDFDPMTSDRTIGIMATDYTSHILLADTFKDLETIAPNMQIEILSMTDGMLEVFERGLADLVITIDSACADGHPNEYLFSEEFVVLGWEENPSLQDELTLEDYLSLTHVVTRFGKKRLPSFEDWYLMHSKLERQMVITTPSFELVAPFLVGTNRITTIHSLMAEKLASEYPLVIKKAPIEIPPINLAVQWHKSASTDPAISWIVESLVDTAKRKTTQSEHGKRYATTL